MILKPQDIVILLKLVVWQERTWSYSSLSKELFMSSSEVHAGINRAIHARLFDQHRKTPLKNALKEFLIYGVKYVYIPNRGSLTRGLPTCYAAPPLNNVFTPSDEMIPVWPDPEGECRGYEFSPLYKSVPKAARKDSRLYELLALVDTLRDGRAREKEMAIQEITDRIT